jgi:hypothetical protein
MSTVSSAPRARRGRSSTRPAPVPPPVAPVVSRPPDALHEGWQPGGAALAVAPPPVQAPARPGSAVERHGKCRLTLSIGGVGYRLRPVPPPPGLKVVWTLRKLEGPAPVAYAVASDGQDIKCTCPDHEKNGARCKHIGALVACGLVARPSGRSGPARGAGPCAGCGAEISPAESYSRAVLLCGDCYDRTEGGVA